MLLDCMLSSCLRFAMLVVMDLRRALGEHMRERACVHVLWVACTREFAGDSAATGVRHFAGIKEYWPWRKTGGEGWRVAALGTQGGDGRPGVRRGSGS